MNKQEYIELLTQLKKELNQSIDDGLTIKGATQYIELLLAGLGELDDKDWYALANELFLVVTTRVNGGEGV